MERSNVYKGIASMCLLVTCLAGLLAVSGCGADSASGVSASASASSETASSSSGYQEASETADDSTSGQIMSESDAVNFVHDCLLRAGKYVPAYIECDRVTDEGRYIIHGYDFASGARQHGADLSSEDETSPESTATSFWYSVGQDGSIYDELFACDVDPTTMEAVPRQLSSTNDYYEINLPPELYGAKIIYEEGHFGGPTTAGAITGVKLDEWKLFEVVVLSDDWGPQGDMYSLNLGVPSASSTSNVYLTVPLMNADGSRVDQAEAEAKAKEYATYVTVL